MREREREREIAALEFSTQRDIVVAALLHARLEQERTEQLRSR